MLFVLLLAARAVRSVGRSFCGPFVLWAARSVGRSFCGPFVPLLGAGGLSCSFAEDVWEVTLLPRDADQIVALCSVVMMIRA